MRIFDYQNRSVEVSELVARAEDASTSFRPCGSDRVSMPEWFRLRLESKPPIDPPQPTAIPSRTRFRWFKLLVEKLIRFQVRQQHTYNLQTRDGIEEVAQRQKLATEILIKMWEEQLSGQAELLSAANGRIGETERAIQQLAADIHELAAGIQEVKHDLGLQMDSLEASATAERAKLIERVMSLERDMRALAHFSGTGAAIPPLASKDDGQSAPAPVQPADAAWQPPLLDYFLFESRFRGSEEQIREAQARYARYFEGREGVVDLACGRGEFLEVLRDRGVHAVGVDTSLDNILLLRSKGLDGIHRDAIEYMRSLPDASIGGVFSAQFVEHVTVQQFAELNRLIYAKLKPGGVFVVETINPATLVVHAWSLYMDLTHQRPVHPITYKFVLETLGFSRVELVFSSSVEGRFHLPHLPDTGGTVKSFNAALDLLNEIVYGPQDYAAVAVK